MYEKIQKFIDGLDDLYALKSASLSIRIIFYELLGFKSCNTNVPKQEMPDLIGAFVENIWVIGYRGSKQLLFVQMKKNLRWKTNSVAYILEYISRKWNDPIIIIKRTRQKKRCYIARRFSDSYFKMVRLMPKSSKSNFFLTHLYLTLNKEQFPVEPEIIDDTFLSAIESFRFRWSKTTHSSVQSHLTQWLVIQDRYDVFDPENEKKAFIQLKVYWERLGDARHPPDGSEEAMQLYEECILRNIRLVLWQSFRMRFLFKPQDFGDVIQSGVLGLMTAVRKFDVTLDNKFSTYALFWIKQSIRRYCQTRLRCVHIPLHIQNKYPELSQNSLVRDAHRFSAPLTEAKRLLSKRIEYDKVDTYIRRKEWLFHDISLRSKDQNERKAYRWQLMKFMNRKLGQINPRLKYIIECRYAINGRPKKKLVELGNEFGITRERVRQLEEQALKKLRKLIPPEYFVENVDCRLEEDALSEA